MTRQLPAEELEEVLRFLSELTGFQFPQWRRRAVEEAVRTTLSRSDRGGRMVARLETDAQLLSDLIGRITIGETWFFREPERFDHMRDVVLPSIVRTRPSDHPLTLWSAGCASGEEAWSLAILLSELGLYDRARIIGTDISLPALEAARRATYRPWSMRGMAPDRLARWFRSDGGRFVLDDRLRERVTFAPLNLAHLGDVGASRGLSSLDLVLCRNVLIYLDRETTARIAGRIYRALAEGGWLVTGAADPMLGDLAPFEVVATPAGIAYRRPEAKAPRRPRPALAAPPPAPAPEPAPVAVEAPDGGDGAAVAEAVRRVRVAASISPGAAAVAEARRACEEHPLCAELWFLLGLLHLDADCVDDAREALHRATYLDRKLAIAHFALGAVLLRTNRPRAASRAYRNAADLAAERPADEPVPLGDGEQWGRLLAAARAQADHARRAAEGANR